MKKHINLLFLIIIIGFSKSFSQIKEKSNIIELYDFLTINSIETGTFDNDTSLIFNQVYLPPFKDSYKNVYAGNLGTAIFQEEIDQVGRPFLDWGITHFNLYKLNSNRRKIFLNKNPYSNLNYLIGSKKEQVLNVIHQQHINNNMIFGIDFLTLASNGFYFRQLSKQRSFDSFYLWHTSNNKYKIIASFSSNKNESQENGGISDVFEFINLKNSRDAEESSVNLTNAQSFNKDNTYFLKQQFNICSRNNNVFKSDSTRFKKVEINLNSSTSYSRNIFVFKEAEPNLNFFDAIFVDSTMTYDSSFVSEINNRFGVSIYKIYDHELRINSEIFSELQNIKLHQNSLDTSLCLLNLGFKTIISKSDLVEFALESKFALSEVVSGSYFVVGNLKYKISNDLEIESLLSLSNYPGSLTSQTYDSNHFRWTNKFENESKKAANIKFELTDLIKLGYGLKLYDNYIYYNADAIPEQLSDKIFISQIELEHLLTWRWINYSGMTSYNLSDNEFVYPLPKIQLFHSLYFADNWFKIDMPIQIGFDFRYNTKYYALAYMPATGQRYIQTEQKIGNYIFADFFFNFRIKNSNIFFKIDHINEGFAKRNYFLIPNYPMMGRSIKLGIKWNFFD